MQSNNRLWMTREERKMNLVTKNGTRPIFLELIVWNVTHSEWSEDYANAKTQTEL